MTDVKTPAEREAAAVADGVDPEIAAAFRSLEEAEERYERLFGPGSLAQASRRRFGRPGREVG